jgi:predicted nucleic acid-binding protein
LGEAYNTLANNKDRFGLSTAEAAAFVGSIARSWNVLSMTESIVLDAVRVADAHRLSYYDAQLWAVAKHNGIFLLLSEDGQHGQTLEGVTYQNPLLAEFDLDQLGPAVS